MSPYPFLFCGRKCAAVVAIAGVLLGSSRASAESITLAFDKMTDSAPVNVRYTIGGNTTYTAITPGPYFWHQTGSPLNANFGNNVATFCVELNQQFGASATAYNVDPLSMKLNPTTTSAIFKLFANNYDTNWANTSFNGSTQSTAFQLALWELVMDGASGSVYTGNFRYNGVAPSAASTLASDWLAELANTPSTAFANTYPNGQLVWLSNGSAQDQIAFIPHGPNSPVPAPPSVFLAGVALGAGVFGRLLRRKS